MRTPAIMALSQGGCDVARKILAKLDGRLYGLEGRTNEPDLAFANTRETLQGLFADGTPIIAVMASGALIRILAPLLSDKHKEPPVVVVSEDGKSVVPLLGGHHGANDLASIIAQVLDGHAAITTAGDLRFGIALDQPPEGWVLANPENAKGAMAALLSGSSVCVEGDVSDQAHWLLESGLPIGVDGDLCLYATTQMQTGTLGGNDLMFVPAVHVLGMGCERGCSLEEAITLAEQLLEDHNIHPGSLAAVASLDVKADEGAIMGVAAHLGIPARFFAAGRLEAETPRLANPSNIVFAEVGCHGVAEGAALAAVGKTGMLVAEKIKSKRATAAISRSATILTKDRIMETGKSRGQLFVVGIGPGQEGWRSPEVSQMIAMASDLVGYSLYLDLIGDISGGKTRHDFDLGKEEDRVRHAMELAGEGRDVALVCSGDAGIYAMATLVFELLQNGGLSEAAKRIGIAVSPGISALQAAAARAGAPLGHDFCTISLSDLLTPWEAIQMRVKAAAEGDFVIAFYNPVSRRRRTQLAYARDVLLQHRPADTPVILATDLGRPAERVRIVPLAELNIDDVDMLTVVIVGSSETRTVKTGDGKTWVYTPRGYAAKEGTRIGADGTAITGAGA
jgi:cobalt-precorrin 5A hydrolase/precorrin-3B C17-methyltransferase